MIELYDVLTRGLLGKRLLGKRLHRALAIPYPPAPLLRPSELLSTKQDTLHGHIVMAGFTHNRLLDVCAKTLIQENPRHNIEPRLHYYHENFNENYNNNEHQDETDLNTIRHYQQLKVQALSEQDCYTKKGAFSGLLINVAHWQGPDSFSRLRALTHTLIPLLKQRGSVVFIGTPHDNVDPPPSPWQQTIPQAFQHTLTVFTKCLAKEYGHCGITINHLSLASNAESALPEILRFFLSTRSAYITGQRVNIYPIHTNPKRWSDVLPHFGKPPQAQTDANHNTNKAPLALITGASGGIGQAIAQRLAQDHYRLIIVDHPKQRFPLRQLAEQTGGMALTLDLCQANAARLISDRVHECGGKLNALVHNAGITRDRLFYNLSDSDWRTVISTNLLAPITITEHLLEQQQLAQHGRIVLMSSVMALSGHSGQSNYCVSKAGLIGFMEAIGPTLRAQQITINAIAPGYIDTPMTRRIPVLLREIAKRLNVFAQMGAPEDVAEAVALCCHPASSGLQQNVLRVCGLMPLGA